MAIQGRLATVTVCDDIRVEASGKLILVGIYTNDIVIPTDEFIATQMQFLFYAECERSAPFEQLKFEVTLPGNDPVSVDLGSPAHLPDDVKPDRTRIYARQIITMPSVKLRPGKIIAKAIHEAGEMLISAGWVVKITPPGTVVDPPAT